MKTIGALSFDRQIAFWVLIFAVAFALWHVGWTIWFTTAAYSPLPWGDSWNYWTRIANDNGFTLRHLWSQHNEHRIVVPRLLFEFDRRWFSANGKLLFAVSLVCPLLTAAVLIRAAPGRSSSTAAKVLLYALIVAAVYACSQYTNFTWSFQIQILLVFAFAFTAFDCYLLSEAELSDSRRRSFFAATFVLGSLASLTMVNGLYVWPILWLRAFTAKAHRRRLLALGLWGGGLWLLYFASYARPLQIKPPIEGLWQLPKSTLFFFTYFGAPLADAADTLTKLLELPSVVKPLACTGFGLALVATAVRCWAGLLHGSDRPLLPRGLVLLLFVQTFLILGGVSTAIGRAPMFPVSEALTSRYNTPAWYFLIATLLMVFHRVAARERKGSAHLPLLLGSTAFMILTNSIYEPAYFLHGLGQGAYLRSAETAITLQVDDAPVWRRTGLQIESIRPPVRFMAEHHLSVFANPWLAILGKRISDVFPSPNDSLKFAGDGFIDEVKTFHDARGWALKASGWAVSSVPRNKIDAVIITDEADLIRGFGSKLYYRGDLPDSITHTLLPMAGWDAYARVSDDCRAVSVYFHLKGVTSPIFFKRIALDKP